MQKYEVIMGDRLDVGSEPLFMGIDGGGTKCRASVFSAGNQLLGTGVGGSANPFQDEAQAKASIVQAVALALADAGLPRASMGDVIAGVGLAGVNVPSVFAAMNSWHHPFKKMYLSTDLHIACLGAHNRVDGAVIGEGAAIVDGAVIVAGTGSCGYAFVKGAATLLGGHGFTLGDKGSGAWLGLEALKAVLLATDKLGSQTCLSDVIGDHLKASGVMLVDKMSTATSSDYAQLARFVVAAAELNDEVAVKIMREGAAYLSALAEPLWATGAHRMSLIGGLSGALMPWLTPSVAARLASPIHPPEWGALYFAKQQFALAAADYSRLTAQQTNNTAD